MTVLEAIRRRRSIRAFADRPVEEEKLQAVLEAGRLAPSAKNMQEWRFIVVRDRALRQKLIAAANDQAFVGQAPVVIVGCGTQCDYRMPCGQPAFLIDVAIAMEHMALAAVEQGLGTCWIGAYKQEATKQLLGIPADVQVVCLMPVGYPVSVPEPRPRRPLTEILFAERWQG
jgi:nitroreductase